MAKRNSVSTSDKRYLGRHKLYKIMKQNVDDKLISDIHMCDYRKYHGCEWAYAYTHTHTVYAIASGFGSLVRVQLLDDDYKVVSEKLVRSPLVVDGESSETAPTPSADSQ